ncbi:hypothetical protein [Moorena sp. SIO4G3]|uniref:hypothetical protein n=1 Tax=Moorena sp. SIO4G3 TaxID=2607821 RepID=UPI00142BEC6B|nr:hypothetical protein [Moorena sp. SIO4G3]NEO76640.1 hypothetical protein [Moorena sp. SIO4G3]
MPTPLIHIDPKIQQCQIFYRFPTPDSRFPTPDSRLPIPDSRFPIPDSLTTAAKSTAQ